MKRLFDIGFSLIGLILTFPIFLLLGIWIKTDSSGPIFYRGARVGKFGKSFKIFKFRTMVMNADKIGGASTANDDPRLTKVGKFIRKLKFDELPQFFNVLLGDMSFVGPRPEVQHYVDMYTEEEKEILNVRPGITDWASIYNPDEGAILEGSPDPEKTYMEKIRPTKLRLQLKYAKEHSFWIDMKIIITTLRVIFFGYDNTIFGENIYNDI